jgi:hypothetical protein
VQVASATASVKDRISVLAMLFILGRWFLTPCGQPAFAAVDLPVFVYIHWAGMLAGAVFLIHNLEDHVYAMQLHQQCVMAAEPAASILLLACIAHEVVEL